MKYRIFIAAKTLVFLLLAMATVCASAQPQDLSAKVDSLFGDYNKAGVPGAEVMVIKDGNILYANAYGLANLDANAINTTNTNFRLASCTKQFTAMAVMILAERKQLSLEDHLTDFFPEFPSYGKRITVRELLNHTSGLPEYGDLIPKGTTIPVTDRDVLWILEKQEQPSFAAGSRFQYCNSGYAILAIIVEKVSGNTFAAFLKRNIFDPLHMTGTFLNERGIATIPNRAYGYSSDGGKFKLADQSLSTYVLGDGGIYTSVVDLYHWDQALASSNLVGSEMLRQAFTAGPETQTGKNKGYGFGWEISQYRGKKCVSHGGGTTGFTTMIKRFPDDKFTVILLANRRQADVNAITQKITDFCLFD